MLLKEEINKYLNYCKFQKELDDKTIKAYRTDLQQFIAKIGKDENNLGKEALNEYLLLSLPYKNPISPLPIDGYAGRLSHIV